MSTKIEHGVMRSCYISWDDDSYDPDDPDSYSNSGYLTISINSGEDSAEWDFSGGSIPLDVLPQISKGINKLLKDAKED